MTKQVPDNIFTMPELPPEVPPQRKHSEWVFGLILAIGLVNFLCCTPLYLGVIGWLTAKIYGE